MQPAELFESWLEGTVQAAKQVDAHGVHLTVAEVLSAHVRGRIDFGGSELEPAGTHPLEPTDRRPGDKYAWWRLEPGAYIVRFNETIKDGAPPLLLTANDRLLSCGCALSAGVCGPGKVASVLSVPACGANIKQNARIALLRAL